jgi:hypothetical protein
MLKGSPSGRPPAVCCLDYRINCRVQKSGSFYKRTARHLFEQGRGVPYEQFEAKDFRPRCCIRDTSGDNDWVSEGGKQHAEVGM